MAETDDNKAEKGDLTFLNVANFFWRMISSPGWFYWEVGEVEQFR